MFSQHAKWLKVSREIPWRHHIASLNYLLSSHVWRRDHNGFSHQDPGFIDHVVNKKAEIIRVPAAGREHPALGRGSLPPQSALRQRDRRRQATGTQLPLDGGRRRPLHERSRHVEWASNEDGDPDVVLACCGDVPTLEALAAAALLRERCGPERGVRERRRPHAPPARERASARPLRHRVRLALHDRPADRLRLPRLPLAHPSPDLPAAGQICTSVATRRRARRRRPSTSSCSTTSTASTSSWT